MLERVKYGLENWDQKKKILLEMEDHLGFIIEDELEKRAHLLANTDPKQITAEILNLNVIKKYLIRSRHADIEAYLNEYVLSQIYLTESLSFENDLFIMSKSISQGFSIEKTIRLFENISQPGFNIEHYFNTHPNPENIPTAMKDFIRQVQNLYQCVEVKKTFYHSAALKQEKAYKNLQESLMWINGQILVCITGLRKVKDKILDEMSISTINANQSLNANLFAFHQLTRALRRDRNLIKLSQLIDQQYGTDVAVKMLDEIEKNTFNAQNFFNELAAPVTEITQLIESIHDVESYVLVKDHPACSEQKTQVSQQLLEKEMWLKLQRKACIEGMLLILSKDVYKDEQIDLAQEVAMVNERLSLRRENAFSQADHENLVNFHEKISEEDAVSMAIERSIDDLYPWMINGMEDEQAALEQALRLSVSKYANGFFQPVSPVNPMHFAAASETESSDLEEAPNITNYFHPGT